MDLIPKKRGDGRVATYTPFDDLFNRFSSLMRTPSFEHLPEAFTRTSFPELETYESDDAFCVDVDLPGLDQDDVNVDLVGQELRIHGERKWEKTRKKHRAGKGKGKGNGSESEYGSFDFTVSLPGDMKFDADSIRAVLEKGVLQIEVPKVEPTPATRIKVQ